MGQLVALAVVLSRMCRGPNPTLWWNDEPGSGQRASNQRIRLLPTTTPP